MDPADRNDPAPAGNNIVGINNTLNGNISQGEIHIHDGANFVLNAYAPVSVSGHAGALSITQQGQGALHPGANNPPAPAPYHSVPYHELLTQQSPEWATEYQPGNLHLLKLTTNDFNIAPEDEFGYAARPPGNHGIPTVSQAVWTILRRTPGRGMKSANIAQIYKDWLVIKDLATAKRTVNSVLSRAKNLFITNGKPDALIGTKTNVALWRIKLVNEPQREAGAGGYHTTEKGKRAGAGSQRKRKSQAAQKHTARTTPSAPRRSTGGPLKRKASQNPIPDVLNANCGQRDPADGPASKKQKARTRGSISKQSTQAPAEHGSIQDQLSRGNLTPNEVEAIHGLVLLRNGNWNPMRGAKAAEEGPRNQPAVVPKLMDLLDDAGVYSKGWNGDSEQREEEAEHLHQEPLQEEYLEVEEGVTLSKDVVAGPTAAGFMSSEADKVDARAQANLEASVEEDATES